jgi:hypothetical protein
MYGKEETTRLEFVSKVVGQIYTVDIDVEQDQKIKFPYQHSG